MLSLLVRLPTHVSRLSVRSVSSLFSKIKKASVDGIEKFICGLKGKGPNAVSKCVNSRDQSNFTPLMFCVIQKPFTNDHLEIMDFLLNCDDSVDINATDDWGRSALHLASFSNNKSAIALLLEHNARIDLLDSDYFMPVDYANSLECDDLLRNNRLVGVNYDNIRKIRTKSPLPLPTEDFADHKYHDSVFERRKNNHRVNNGRDYQTRKNSPLRGFNFTKEETVHLTNTRGKNESFDLKHDNNRVTVFDPEESDPNEADNLIRAINLSAALSQSEREQERVISLGNVCEEAIKKRPVDAAKDKEVKKGTGEGKSEDKCPPVEASGETSELKP